MRYFLFYLLKIVLVALLVQYIIYIPLKSLLDHKSNFRITRYFRHSKHKYFALGNSRCVNSFNEKFAIDSFKMDAVNLGFNGQQYNNMMDIFTDITSKNKDCVIFIEVSCLAENKPDNSYSYYIQNSTFIEKRYSESIYNFIPLLRLNNELFLRNIYYLRKSDNDWVNNYTISRNIISSIKSDTNQIFLENRMLLKARIDELNSINLKSNNKIIYFLAPYYPAFRTKISDYEKVVQIFKDNCKAFIDFNELPLPDSVFADRLHTNVSGSFKLTELLEKASKQF